jgi:hypothetical protein
VDDDAAKIRKLLRQQTRRATIFLITAGPSWQEGAIGSVISRADASTPQGHAPSLRIAVDLQRDNDPRMTSSQSSPMARRKSIMTNSTITINKTSDSQAALPTL